MNKVAAVLLALSTTVNAEIPTREVEEVQVSNNQIIFVTPRTDYKVIHDCQLYLSEKSAVQINPLRSSRSIKPTHSLVITVDGNRKVCGIEHIEEVVA